MGQSSSAPSVAPIASPNAGAFRAEQSSAPAAAPRRDAPIDLAPDEFRRVGHALVDAAAELLATLDQRPVAPGLTPSVVRGALGDDALPEAGGDPADIVRRAMNLLARYSTFNGHPRFMGYITAGASPIGVLGEMLAATINANCGAWSLSPLATEIELRTVRWIAQLLGYPDTAGGVLVSGGNMANIVCVLAARMARARWNVREDGVMPPAGTGSLVLYASTETHTWVQKAAEVCGLGERAIRWIPVDADQRMQVDALHARIRDDRAHGFLPMLAVGTAGTVSTGAIDPLREIARVCREEGIWFHVDGAYGAPAAMLPESSDDLRSLAFADSLAVDPHKWLYAPLEAGCALVRDADALHDAFHHRPPYYHFGGEGDVDAPVNFHEWGPQNSRGSRALKIWLALQQVGRDGYRRMIRDDIALARLMDDRVRSLPDLEPATCRLSITSFRFVPSDLRASSGSWRLPGEGGGSGVRSSSERVDRDAYLDALNTALLSAMQDQGLAYVSNAVLDGRFHLRACIVNFRTTAADAAAVPELAVRIGRALDRRMRGSASPYAAAEAAGAERHPLERLTDAWWGDLRARLEHATASMVETATMLSRAPALASTRGAPDLDAVVRRLAAGDRRAAARIAALRRGDAPPADAPRGLADLSALEELRQAQHALLAAISEVTPEERIVERRIVQEGEARVVAYEAERALFY